MLCRSPGYTPPSADALYDLTRNEFVDLAQDCGRGGSAIGS